MGVNELLSRHLQDSTEFYKNCNQALQDFETHNQGLSERELSEKKVELMRQQDVQAKHLVEYQYQELAKEALAIEIKEKLEENRRNLEAKRKERGMER